MSQIDQFLVALKKSLKKKNIVYRDLAPKLGLSESSVKRILSSKALTLERLEQICKAAEIKFSDICRATEFEENEDEAFFSETQEKAFVDSPRLFHLYLLLDDGLSVAKILRDYDISEGESQKFLLLLDRLKLIELHPRDRVKVLNKGNKRFRKEGPMGKLLFEQARTSYLQSNFRNDDELLRFQMGYMSSGTVAKLKAKIEKFLNESREDYIYENQESNQVQTYGILVAVRPWKYAWMDSIKKRKA